MSVYYRILIYSIAITYFSNFVYHLVLEFYVSCLYLDYNSDFFLLVVTNVIKSISTHFCQDFIKSICPPR